MTEVSLDVALAAGVVRLASWFEYMLGTPEEAAAMCTSAWQTDG